MFCPRPVYRLSAAGLILSLSLSSLFIFTPIPPFSVTLDETSLGGGEGALPGGLMLGGLFEPA